MFQTCAFHGSEDVEGMPTGMDNGELSFTCDRRLNTLNRVREPGCRSRRPRISRALAAWRLSCVWTSSCQRQLPPSTVAGLSTVSSSTPTPTAAQTTSQ